MKSYYVKAHQNVCGAVRHFAEIIYAHDLDEMNTIFEESHPLSMIDIIEERKEN